jgi:hypothetical protein
LIESESFFRSPKFEGALEGQADEGFRCGGLRRKRLPEFQNLAVFGPIEELCGLTFEG